MDVKCIAGKTEKQDTFVRASCCNSIILLVMLLFSLPAFGLMLTSKQTLCRAFMNGAACGGEAKGSCRPALTS